MHFCAAISYMGANLRAFKILSDGIFVYSKPDAAYLKLRHC
jgi:hypothetical protein